ncbi:MAG: cytochrome c [Saprospiraceae bacterium]|nr:cytochrome c [Saprospiraceae bacterium]
MNKFLLNVVLFSAILISACNESPYMQGKYLYERNCMNCHMPDGSGLSALIPPLKNSLKLGTGYAVCIIINGNTDTIFSNDSYLVKEMPAFKNLSSTELTNIVNYINHSFAVDFKESNIKEVQKTIENCYN